MGLINNSIGVLIKLGVGIPIFVCLLSPFYCNNYNTLCSICQVFC